MGAIRSSVTTLFSVGAAGAVLALAAPAALAAEAAPITSFGFAITPSTVAPGGRTVLSVTGCDAAFATASSGIFDTVSIARGQTVRVTVDSDARRGAQYSVSFTCNGETGSADVTIAGATSTPTTSSTTGSRTSTSPSASAAASSPAASSPAAAVAPPRTTPASPPRTTAVTPARTTAAAVPPRTTAPVPRTTTEPAARATTGTVSGNVTASGGASLGVRGGLGGSVAGMDPLELGAGAGLFLIASAGTAYALRRRRSSNGH
ncbi:hypothetical protein [Streptomyces sp. NPDC057939]|uniref:hypothetical protein n=1 Tax=Streptomyces sp. NPDC057939 TaxID=3346284 RepID=UPI0036E529B0